MLLVRDRSAVNIVTNVRQLSGFSFSKRGLLRGVGCVMHVHCIYHLKFAPSSAPPR
jgi:hypothetical protein